MQGRGLDISLLLLLVTVFVVMPVWMLDKFINAQHAGAVTKKSAARQAPDLSI